MYKNILYFSNRIFEVTVILLLNLVLGFKN